MVNAELSSNSFDIVIFVLYTNYQFFTEIRISSLRWNDFDKYLKGDYGPFRNISIQNILNESNNQ